MERSTAVKRSKPAPFTILYHINAEFLLLDEDIELVLTFLNNEPYDEISRSVPEFRNIGLTNSL